MYINIEIEDRFNAEKKYFLVEVTCIENGEESRTYASMRSSWRAVHGYISQAVREYGCFISAEQKKLQEGQMSMFPPDDLPF